MEHQGSLPRDGGRCSMPGDHFMALIKFSSGIECLRHRVVASIATMERILTGSWRRFQRIVDAKRSMKGAGGYYTTTLECTFNTSVLEFVHRLDIEYFPLIRNFDRCCDPCCIRYSSRWFDSKRFYISIARRFLSRTIFHSSRNVLTIRGGKLLDENCRVFPHIFFDIPV